MKTTIRQVALRGVVGAVPGNPLPIASLPSNLTAEELRNLYASVGLEQVYRCSPGQTAGDLCLAGARHLLEKLQWTPETIDGVFVVTQTPDHFLPATACIIHHELGLHEDCIAFDIGLGCSGYVYGLWTAAQFIASGSCRRVLLLAGDTISRLVSPEDKSVSVLFGDAGSATALEFDPEASPIAFVGGSDGSGAADLIVPSGAFRSRAAHGYECRSPATLHMDGISVFNFALKRIPPLLNAVLTERCWKREEADLFLLHQANAFMLKNLARRFNIEDRLPLNIGKYGNTSVASIPLLLADEVSSRVTTGKAAKTVMAGFGVGYSWAAAATELSGLRAVGVVRVKQHEGAACTTR